MKRGGNSLFVENNSSLQINSHILSSLPYRDVIIQKVIDRINQQKLFLLEENTLGILFERLIREEERKDLGQFYTPQKVVSYMINSLGLKPDSKVLDPTCGCGVFLVTAYNYLKQINPNAIKNIYGVDLNESATKITRINLWLRNGRDLNSLKALEKNIRIGNSIVENKKIDNKNFIWNKEFNAVLKEGFDFIIGNPPYVTLKNGKDYDVRESVYSRIANGSTNCASLILTKSFELLRDDGKIAFVLPKTLLRVNSYSKLRNFILDNSKILHIFDLGSFFSDVRGEQIILILQKSKNKKDIENNKVLIKVYKNKNEDLLNQEEFIVPQKLFKKYNNFLIFDDIRYYELIEKISQLGEPLKNLGDIFRGLPISPKSRLITKYGGKNKLPIIKGNNLSKFDYRIEYYVDENFKDNKLDKLKNNKIILQNIFSSEGGIISTLDTKGSLTFDTITNIIKEDNRISNEYLLGLLNSKLLNFYLMYGIFNKSKLTMHTDKAYIGELPIIITSKNKQLKISNIINKLRKKYNKALLRELDEVVYKIYNVNMGERHLIEKGINEMMSKKSVW